MRNGLWLAGLVATVGVASGLSAQANDSLLYKKAQDMVANGDATAGRALADSLLHATSPDSVGYANGLYWNAVIANSAADAELDYRRIIVDYPTSPRVQDALLKISQLELTRGEYDEALQHLRRIPAEYPNSPSRARASYWIARTLFEKNDPPNACAASNDAMAHVNASDIELKNQIEYQQQQCRGVVVATPKDVQNTAVVPAVTTPAVAPKRVASTPKVLPKPPRKPVPPAPKPTPSAPADAPATPAPAETLATPVATAAPVAAKSVAEPYSVQVAAFYDRTQADALAKKLLGRGYESARVDGTKAPFRVRIGHFKTHAAAAQMLATLKAKKITGFVAEE